MSVTEKTQLQERIEAFIRNKISMLENSLDGLKETIPPAVDTLVSTEGKVIVTGIGKSGLIAMKVVSTMTSLGLKAHFLHAAEAFHGELAAIEERDVVMVFSHSGETREALRLLRHLKKNGLKSVAVTGNPDAELASEADCVVAYRMAEEGSPSNIAPMASTTAMLVIGDLLAAAIAERKGFTKDRFASGHPGGALALQLTPVSEIMRTGEGIPSIERGSSFRQAALAITRGGLGVVAVKDADEKIVGVMTDGDIRRFLQSTAFDPEVPVEQVMTPGPITIHPDQPLLSTLQVMEKKKIMSLFVTDQEKKIVGIIHMHQIIEEKVI